jgi:hypothetical protein
MDPYIKMVCSMLVKKVKWNGKAILVSLILLEIRVI